MIWPLGDGLFSAEHLEELRRVDDVVSLGSRREPSDVRQTDVY